MLTENYHDRDVTANTYVMQPGDVITLVNSIAERLKWARERLGLSQQQVAEVAKVTQGTIANIESGLRRNPRELIAIARAVRLEPLWLKEGTGPRESANVQTTEGSGVAGAPNTDETSAPKPTVASTLNNLGELLQQASPKTRAAVADLLGRYAQDPATGRSLAQAIEVLIKADQNDNQPGK